MFWRTALLFGSELSWVVFLLMLLISVSLFLESVRLQWGIVCSSPELCRAGFGACCQCWVPGGQRYMLLVTVLSAGRAGPAQSPGSCSRSPSAPLLPQAEGYVIGSCIKHIPIAGRDITYFIQQLLREREVGIPPEQSLETAKAIKVKTDGKRAGLGVREKWCLDTSPCCHHPAPAFLPLPSPRMWVLICLPLELRGWRTKASPLPLNVNACGGSSCKWEQPDSRCWAPAARYRII